MRKITQITFFTLWAMLLLLVTSCVSSVVQEMSTEVERLEMGLTLDEVATRLQEIQDRMPQRYQKSSIRYITSRGVDVFIYYARVQASAENNTPEELYTPLVFHGNILVGIGWEAIGRAMN